jgi:hypothetical protein
VPLGRAPCMPLVPKPSSWYKLDKWITDRLSRPLPLLRRPLRYPLPTLMWRIATNLSWYLGTTRDLSERLWRDVIGG